MCPRRMILLTLLGALCIAPQASAAVPHLVRYQGYLTDDQGAPSDGQHTLIVRIFDSATGGTALWDETHADVPIRDGNFSVLLGSVTPLDLTFEASTWLEVEVAGDAPMSPRQPITSVPLAYRAETLDDPTQVMPIGAIILWRGAECPAGYTRVVEYDGKHLVGGPAAGVDQGRDNQSLVVANLPPHDHALGSHLHEMASHSHKINLIPSTQGECSPAAKLQSSGSRDIQCTGNPTVTTTGAGAGLFTGPASGTTDLTGSGATFDNRPDGRTVLLCEKE